ncbi:heptaprenyl diphosphate synthase component 1 [Bacillus sp. AK128]
MSDINRKKTYMLEKINQFIHHSYLKKFIDTPKVDEDKLLLLVAMCDHIDYEKDKTIEAYIITTMLVQVALDVHEEVSTKDDLGDLEQKQQQLKVLAGDYFSGLYYSILAQIEDIQMIKTIATSIKRINEHKIRVYRQESSYLETMIDSLRIIESELFVNVAQTLKLTGWSSLIGEILLLKRLYKEKFQYIDRNSSLLSHHLIKENSSSKTAENKITANIDLMIMNTQERIQSILTKTTIESSIIKSLRELIRSFDRQVHQIVEEG